MTQVSVASHHAPLGDKRSGAEQQLQRTRMITLVLGGVRSGKSAVAEHHAGEFASALDGPSGRGVNHVTYLATARVAIDDPAMAERIAAHRKRRPASWATIEAPYSLAETLGTTKGVVLLDSLGTWLADILDTPDEVAQNVDDLLAALAGRADPTVIVSEEVGMSVHPATEIGRHFADCMGELNRRISEIADHCLLVVAGRVTELPPSLPSSTHSGNGPHPSSRVGKASGLRSAIAFLTPLGGASAPHAGTYDWFPFVGALLGAVLGGSWWLALEVAPPITAAALVVMMDVALTGALHLDGLADSADGLFAHLPRNRRLAVMAEPQTGAFGVVAVVCSFGLRFAALAAFATAQPWLLAALWCMSRTEMAVASRRMPYARDSGLAASLLGGPAWRVAIVGGVLSLALAIPAGATGLAAVVAGVIAACAVHLLAQRQIGGFTGDTLGASGVVAETIGLIAAAMVAS